MSSPSTTRKTPGPAWLRRVLPWLVTGLAALPLLLVLAGFLLLKGYDLESLKPRLSQAVQEATGYDLILGGALELQVAFRPRLTMEAVSLVDPSRGAGPPLASARRVEVAVELWPLLLRRQLVVQRLGLEGLELLVEAQAPGRADLTALLPAPATPAPPAQATPPDHREIGGLAWFHFRNIEIKQARLDWRRSGQAPLILQVESLGLRQELENGPLEFTVKGSMDSREFSLQGQIKAPELTGQPWPLEAVLHYPGLELQAQGRVQDPLAAQGLDLLVNCQVAEPARLGLPSLPGPWRLSGRLSDPRGQTYRLEGLELEGPLGKLQGLAQVDWLQGRPRVGADLSGPALDLCPWWDAKPAGGAASPNAPRQGERRPGRVFSSAPLPLESLRAFDLNLRLRTGSLKMPRLDLAQVDLNLELNQGRLSLNPLEASLAGGPGSLRLTLTPQGDQAQAQIKLKLSRCQIGQVLRRAGTEQVLSGRLEAQVEAQGRGESLAAIMANLDGKLVAAVRGGQLNLRHLGILGADLAGGILSALGEAVGAEQSNALHCLVLGLLAKDGQVHSTALALDSQQLVLLGRGKLNLKNEELDLAWRPLPKAGLTAAGGVGLSMGQLAKPFKLTGTLAKPRLSLDEGQVLATLGKTLGGFAALGPLGLAAALASSGEADSQMCRDAMAAATKGVHYEPKAGVSNSLERMGESLGHSLQRALGR
ncbi:MAG: AsmA family protein [Pseudomonadota bacterium]